MPRMTKTSNPKTEPYPPTPTQSSSSLDGYDSSEPPSTTQPKKKGRKLAETPAFTKRQNQKREAARAFRERQRIHLENLETQLKELKEREAVETQGLRERLLALESENALLRAVAFSFQPTTTTTTTAAVGQGVVSGDGQQFINSWAYSVPPVTSSFLAGVNGIQALQPVPQFGAVGNYDFTLF
ncbi:hypothetical protein HDU79_011659 [Rhizoclosmatium sp. JEL0117]|nr:hypothetical protein HDU79_011659 [Rhizoclosmatium sp. JEL0117]